MATNRHGPMNLSALLDAGFAVYREHFVALVGSVAVIVVPLALAQLLLHEVGFLPALLLGILPSAVAARVVADAAAGRTPTVASVWNELSPQVVALILTGVLVLLAVIVGVLLLVVPAIIFGVWFSMVAPVVTIEDLRYGEAMRRSRELVSGSWWRVFGILLLVGLVAGLIGAVAGSPFASGSALRPSTGSIVADTVVNLLITPYTAVISALLYFDLRLRKEGVGIAGSLEPPPAE